VVDVTRASRASRLQREARWLLIGLAIGVGVECAVCARMLVLDRQRTQRSWLQRSAWGADDRLWSSSLEKSPGAVRVRIAFQPSVRPTRSLPSTPPAKTPAQLIEAMVIEQPWLVIPRSLQVRAAAQPGAGELAATGEFFALAVGWPLLAFSGDTYAAESSGGADGATDVERNWLYVLPASADDVAARAPRSSVPLRPIWIGLALNAALFGVLPLTLLRMMVAVPAFRRRRRGRCGRCSHQLLATQTTCPECGLTR